MNNNQTTPYDAKDVNQELLAKYGVEVLAPAAYTADSAEEAALNALREERSNQQIDAQTLSAIWED